MADTLDPVTGSSWTKRGRRPHRRSLLRAPSRPSWSPPGTIGRRGAWPGPPCLPF